MSGSASGLSVRAGGSQLRARGQGRASARHGLREVTAGVLCRENCHLYLLRRNARVPSRSIGRARQLGRASANGLYVAFLASDRGTTPDPRPSPWLPLGVLHEGIGRWPGGMNGPKLIFGILAFWEDRSPVNSSGDVENIYTLVSSLSCL